jgi:hypothetical protein
VADGWVGGSISVSTGTTAAIVSTKWPFFPKSPTFNDMNDGLWQQVHREAAEIHAHAAWLKITP